MSDNIADLKIDRKLIEPKFEGYKLSLDSIPIYRISLTTTLRTIPLSGDQYSYQHVKLSSRHNHLILDPCNPNAVYYVANDLTVNQIVINEDNHLSETMVFKPPCVREELTDGYNISLHFPSSDWLILSDGVGKMYIIYTGNRQAGFDWQVKYVSEPCNGKPFILVHAIYRESSGNQQNVECLLMHIDENIEADESSSNFFSVLEWLSLSAVDNRSWTITRVRRLMGKNIPDYAAIENFGGALVVAADRPFKMMYDSIKPLAVPPTEDCKTPVYTWGQTSEDVVISYPVEQSFNKLDVIWNLTASNIEVGLKNGPTLLKGKLYGAVDPEGSVWIVTDNIIEIFLLKQDNKLLWKEFIIGDCQGQMLLDNRLVEEMHNRLAQMTSDSQVKVPSNSDQPAAFNPQDLEECDIYPEDTSVLQRFCGETHLVTHQVSLSSHQWLFNVFVDPSQMPCICLRHDVDGLIWLPQHPTEDEPNPWKHLATFNAFGYVQASKQNRKFASCPPNFSFCTLCDCYRHIYIYWQPNFTNLRNRITGQKINQVAKQQVVSLESRENIFGFATSNKHIFALTAQTLYVIDTSQSNSS